MDCPVEAHVRWNAAWSVATILTGLLSFMLSDEWVRRVAARAQLTCRVTAGGIRTTAEQKKALAKTSHAFNLNNRKFRVSAPSTAARCPSKGPS